MDLTLCKQYNSLDTADASRDTLMSGLMDAALAVISNELGYSVASHQVTQQVVGHSVIPFSDLSTPTVTSLVVKYRNDLTDTAGTTDTTLTAWLDYYIQPRHIELRAYRCEEPRIILTYTAGWTILPPAIEQAAREYVAYCLRLVAQLQPDEKPDTRIPGEVANLIDFYKVLRLP